MKRFYRKLSGINNSYTFFFKSVHMKISRLLAGRVSVNWRFKLFFIKCLGTLSRKKFSITHKDCIVLKFDCVFRDESQHVLMTQLIRHFDTFSN